MGKSRFFRKSHLSISARAWTERNERYLWISENAFGTFNLSTVLWAKNKGLPCRYLTILLSEVPRPGYVSKDKSEKSSQ